MIWISLYFECPTPLVIFGASSAQRVAYKFVLSFMWIFGSCHVDHYVPLYAEKMV
jgi:hypothetical protein